MQAGIWEYDSRSDCAKPFLLNIKNIREKFSVTVYPNPSEGMFYLTNTGPKNFVELELYDLSGRAIAHKQIFSEDGNFSFSFDGIEPGMYLLKGQSGEHQFNQKISIR